MSTAVKCANCGYVFSYDVSAGDMPRCRNCGEYKPIVLDNNRLDMVQQRKKMDRLLEKHRQQAKQTIKYCPTKPDPDKLGPKLFDLACRVIGGAWLFYGAYLLIKQVVKEILKYAQ